MKNIYSIFLGILLLMSCGKEILTPQKEKPTSTHKISQRTSIQIGRVTMQLWRDSSNLTINHLDFAEYLFSDSFSNKIDANDSVKEVVGMNHLAIKPVFDANNPLTKRLLVREKRMYPQYRWAGEFLQLKVWLITQTPYYIKFTGSNFPDKMNAYLYDNVLKKYTLLPTHSNQILWIKVDASTDALLTTSRFSIFVQDES